MADEHSLIQEIFVDLITDLLPEAELITTDDGLQTWNAYQQRGGG